MFDDRVFTFLTLYEEMNYHRTAEKRQMTQPGVTQHIKYLENLYGIKLFHYENRTLHRTAEAEQFKRHLDSMLAEEQAMREEFAKKPGISLRIGATKTIGEFVLPPIISRFLQQPNHNLDFTIDNTEVLLQMLENQQLDFSIVEGVFDKSRYDYRLCKKEKFTGICAKSHHFAGKSVPLDEIFKETLLLREKGSGTRRLLEQAIHDRGFSLENFSRTVSLSNFSVLMDLLLQTNAITFAYQPIAQQRRDLTTFSVQGMAIEGEFNFVYCNRSIGEEKVRLLFADFDSANQ